MWPPASVFIVLFSPTPTEQSVSPGQLGPFHGFMGPAESCVCVCVEGSESMGHILGRRPIIQGA